MNTSQIGTGDRLMRNILIFWLVSATLAFANLPRHPLCLPTWQEIGFCRSCRGFAAVPLPSGRTATNSYDARGRLTSRSDSLGTLTYQLDPNGYCTNLFEGIRTNAWVFDAYERPASYRDPVGNLLQCWRWSEKITHHIIRFRLHLHSISSPSLPFEVPHPPSDASKHATARWRSGRWPGGPGGRSAGSSPSV